MRAAGWILVAAAACAGEAPQHGPAIADGGGAAHEDALGPSGDAAHEIDAHVVNACDDQGVSAAGSCSGPAEVTRCVDGVRVVVEACPAGHTCHVLGGEAVCLDEAECAGVGPLGRCVEDTLWRCDGSLAVTECAAGETVCGYVDDATGYACVTPGATGSLRVSGTVRYEERELSPGALAPPVPAPVRGGTVVVLDDDTDDTLATVSTSDDGTYVAWYDAPPGGRVRIVAYSRSRAAVRPARVRNASGYLHAVGSDPFAAATTRIDILATDASNTGEAFSILDVAVRAMDWLRARGVTTFAPVYMYWQAGSATGSYYLGGENRLHLDGGDGYDDVVAAHELGHYFQDEYSASDSPGGAHDGSPADPRLAWGEGGATWFAIALLDRPYYIDYSAGGGWYVELEETVHDANASGSMSQYVSEWMVAELLWDVGDAALDSDGDAMIAGNEEQVMDVLLGYLVSPAGDDRGVSGVDLVDWLDGWFVHHGIAECAAMTSLVNGVFEFPYDFAGPAGACP